MSLLLAVAVLSKHSWSRKLPAHSPVPKESFTPTVVHPGSGSEVEMSLGVCLCTSACACTHTHTIMHTSSALFYFPWNPLTLTFSWSIGSELRVACPICLGETTSISSGHTDLFPSVGLKDLVKIKTPASSPPRNAQE